MVFFAIARSLLLSLALLAAVNAQLTTHHPEPVARASVPVGKGPAVSAEPSTTSPSVTSFTSAASSTRTTPITTTVSVGYRSRPHQFWPHEVHAQPGDTILFEFYPRNHSVVEADWMVPCQPANKKNIFFSGHFNDFDEDGSRLIGKPPTWSLRVNHTEPTFFYCSALDSCTPNGMVGAINPNSSMTWQHQHGMAVDALYQLEPGQAPPTEGHQPGSSSSSSSNGIHLSKGAIAGIVVGVVAFVTILGALLFVLGRNRVYKRWMFSHDGRSERTAQWAFSNNNDGPWSPRKSGVESTGIPAMAESYHQTPYEATQTAMMPPSDYNPHFRHTSPPPPPGIWSWDAAGIPQEHNQPPPPPPPVELDGTPTKPS